jgi:hypothetical protein
MVGTVRFEARIQELVETIPDLVVLVEQLLVVRRALREQMRQPPRTGQPPISPVARKDQCSSRLPSRCDERVALNSDAILLETFFKASKRRRASV